MLKKRNRLTRREFAHLLKHGRRVHGEYVTVIYLPPHKTMERGQQTIDTAPTKISNIRYQISETLTSEAVGGRTQVSGATPSPLPSPSRERGPLPTTYNLQPTTCLRAGVVVSKKVARKAVARNTVRRAVYRILGELLPPNENVRIAVLTRPGILTVSHEDLQRELQALLTRC